MRRDKRLFSGYHVRSNFTSHRRRCRTGSCSTCRELAQKVPIKAQAEAVVVRQRTDPAIACCPSRARPTSARASREVLRILSKRALGACEASQAARETQSPYRIFEAIGGRSIGRLMSAILASVAAQPYNKERAVAGSVPCERFGSLQQEYDRSRWIA